mmetsp:Transcript_62917/g.189818  ORF Transcript_62917/g.189818 Transcript_62917/m.189818 type:complete len:312 (+) Transcript_62917:80-1015(+)
MMVPSIIVSSAPDDGCWSYVGQVSGDPERLQGSQPLNLGRGCETIGLASHQLGHALGLLHEQARLERNKHVAVYVDNVQEGMLHQFVSQDQVLGSSHGVARQAEYDILSVMHYAATAFSKDGSPTLVPHDVRMTPYMGQRMGFSHGDIENLGALYGCRQDTRPTTSQGLPALLSARAESLVAPLTQVECLCEEGWAAKGMKHCATAANGWCCDPDGDSKGAWCITKGACQGQIWGYCRPRDPAREPVAPMTQRGCKCRSGAGHSCAAKENGYCCNPDGDPIGPWCYTEAPCGGVGYDYCIPAVRLNASGLY